MTGLVSAGGHWCAPAALFACVSTLALVALDRWRALGWWLAYALVLALGCLQQPLWLLVAAGHFLWAASRRSLFGTILALEIVAAGAFALALSLLCSL